MNRTTRRTTPEQRAALREWGVQKRAADAEARAIKAKVPTAQAMADKLGISPALVYAHGYYLQRKMQLAGVEDAE